MLSSRIGAGRSVLCVAALAALSLFPQLARAEDERFELAPDNSDVIAFVKVAEIFQSPAFESAKTEFADFAKKLDEPLGQDTKLTPRDIESIFVAANTTEQAFVVVFNMAKDVELDEVIDENQQEKSETIGEYTMYLMPDDQAICLVDENTIAFGPTKTLRAVLKRDDEAEMSDELTTAWENVEENQHLYIVATLAGLMKQASTAFPGDLPIPAEHIEKLKTASFTAQVGKQKIKFSTSLNCTDNATAEQLKGMLDLMLEGGMQAEAGTPDECQASSDLRQVVSRRRNPYDYPSDRHRHHRQTDCRSGTSGRYHFAGSDAVDVRSSDCP